jgi:putative alpha-1,2-mannosidase
LGRDKEFQALNERGSYWRNVFNRVTGLPAGTQFSTAAGDAVRPGERPVVWLVMVPQDARGLAAAMGGKDQAAPRLDGFFHDTQGN